MNKYLLQSEFLMEFFINQKEYDDFRKKIIKFIHFLEKEESFIDNKYMDNKEFENISLIEAPRKMQILSKEANQRIAFNWKISCFKALQLMKGLVSNFENDNHYIALILLRNFSEVSSMLYYTYKKIEPLVEEINSTNSNKKYFEIHDKLEAISRKFSYGSKIPEYKDKYPDLEIPNILTTIDKITKDKYKNFRLHYNGLSDIAHPSGMSNRIFGLINDGAEEYEELKENEINLCNLETEYYFRNFSDVNKEAKFFSPIMMLRPTIVFMITKNIEIFKETVLNMKKIKIKTYDLNSFQP